MAVITIAASPPLRGASMAWSLAEMVQTAKWEWWHYPLFLLAGAVLKMAWRRVHGQPVAVPRGTKKL